VIIALHPLTAPARQSLPSKLLVLCRLRAVALDAARGELVVLAGLVRANGVAHGQDVFASLAVAHRARDIHVALHFVLAFWGVGLWVVSAVLFRALVVFCVSMM